MPLRKSKALRKLERAYAEQYQDSITEAEVNATEAWHRKLLKRMDVDDQPDAVRDRIRASVQQQLAAID